MAKKTPQEITRDIFEALDKKEPDYNLVQQLLDQKPDVTITNAEDRNIFGEFVVLSADRSELPSGFSAMLRSFVDHRVPYIDRKEDSLLYAARDYLIPLSDFIYIATLPGVDINHRKDSYSDTLLQAVIPADPQKIDYLLNDRPDYNLAAKGSQGSTAMHTALQYNRRGLIDKLLAKGLDINALDDKGRTPLSYLLNKGQFADNYETSKNVLHAIEKGAVLTPGDPNSTLPVYKDAILGYMPGKGEGVKIFDRMIKEISQLDTKLSRRIPKPDMASKEFKAFAEVLAKVHAFASALDPRHPQQISLLLVDMLERTQGDWQSVRNTLKDFTVDDCHDVADAVRGFAESVVLPELVQRTKSRASFIDYNTALDTLLPEVARVLIGDRSMTTMLHLSHNWHERLGALDDVRVIARRGKWEKAAPDFIATNGYRVTFLETAEKLTREGEEMDHCVGGYAENCKSKPVHIASIQKPQAQPGLYQSVATVEFKENQNGPVPLVIKQLRGVSDAMVLDDSSEKTALNEFMQKIHTEYKREDKISIDLPRLKKLRDESRKNQESGDLKEVIGYDPLAKDAPEQQDKFFHLYLDINSGVGRTVSFIPGGKTANAHSNAQDFLEETGLLKTVERLAQNPPLKENINKNYRG